MLVWRGSLTQLEHLFVSRVVCLLHGNVLCLFASRESVEFCCFLHFVFSFTGYVTCFSALYINYVSLFFYRLSLNLQYSPSFRSCGIVFGVVYNFYHFFSPKTLNKQSITEHSSNLRIEISDQPQRAEPFFFPKT